jgi:hypothetical protein
MLRYTAVCPGIRSSVTNAKAFTPEKCMEWQVEYGLSCKGFSGHP